MIRNLKIFSKLLLLAVLIPLTAAIVAGVALNKTQSLKYEYDNLYGFMLLPIVDLDEANLVRESLDGNLHQLANPDISVEKRAELVNAIQSDDARLSVLMDKYQNEWLSTLSPEFTASLVAIGQQGLQTEEADALAEIFAVYSAYAPHRDALLSGSDSDLELLFADLNQMESAFDKLVQVNLVFAELSNESAQAAIAGMRQLLLVVPIVLTLIALGAAYYISRSIINPINQLRVLAEKISLGDLSATMNIDSKDEIGDLAQAFGRMVASVKFLMAEETSKE